MSNSNFKISKIVNRASYEGNPLQIYEVEHKDGSMISRKDMIALCNDKFLTAFRSKYVDGLISVTIEHPNRYYSADTSYLHDNINFFSSEDYEEFDSDPNEYQSFRISFMPMNHLHNAGGADPNNDCLINCIKKFFTDNKKKFFFQPEVLKEQLKIERTDPIPISRMSEVETYMNDVINLGQSITNPYAIHVSGDVEYISPIQTNKVIRIVLNNGHYIIDQKVRKIRDRSFDERTIVLYEFDDGAINSYDGHSESVMTQQEFEELNTVSSSVLLVNSTTFKKSNYVKSQKRKELTLVDIYELYIEMADEMKRESDGKFNFYKTGSFKQMALNYFYDITKAVQPEEITATESQWIEKASYGALTHWESYKGNVVAYDVNSMYPYVMHKNQHYFPMKEGQFQTLDKISEKPEYGIYRAIISKPDGKPYKMFQFNKLNYYTHLTIETAFVYGLTVELIIDGKPNALTYTKDKLMNGAFLFQRYVKELYALKLKKVKGSKDLLSILWGGCTETKLYEYYDHDDRDTNITEAVIFKIHAGDKISIKCHHIKHKLHRTNWGRIKAFVLSYARNHMFYCFRRFEDDIVRINTDCIYLRKDSDLIKTGTNIGNLKLEYKGYIEISGLNKMLKINA